MIFKIVAQVIHIGANYTTKLKLLGSSELLPTSAPSKQLCVSQRGVRRSRGGGERGGEGRSDTREGIEPALQFNRHNSSNIAESSRKWRRRVEDINPIKQKLQNYRPGEKLERAEGRDYFADINITSLAVQ